MISSRKLVSLDGSQHPHNPRIKEVGKADPNEILSVTLHLRSRNHSKDFLGRELSALVAGRRKPMTRDEWEDKYGADPADIKHIETVAGEHGLTAGATHLGSRTMTLMGTSARISAFFGVERMKFTSPAGTFSGHFGKVHVPAEIASMIEDVVGLDNRRQTHQQLEPQWIIGASAQLTPLGFLPTETATVNNVSQWVTAPLAELTQSGYLPTEIATVYSFPKQFTGKGVTVGVIELGGGYDLDDIQKYCAFMNSPMPTIISVSVDGTTNSPQGNTKEYDGEVVGDIETIVGAAPGATIAAYFSKNTNQGFLDAVNYAVHDKQHQPSILSVSWGSPESSFAPRTLKTFNNVLQQAALLGITVCCASGDCGSSAGISGGEHVSFPASSPYALACGGTTLVVSDNNTIVSETVWNNSKGASGGGFSEVFPIPDWQASSDAAKQGKNYKKNGRGVPDVASVGDPQTGFLIFVNGKYCVGAGTSAAAPLWAAMIARVNESLGRAAGFINPLLYQSASDFEKAGAFRAITTGDNGFYHAGPGWNPCTGYGTPNGTKFADAIAKCKTPKAMAARR